MGSPDGGCLMYSYYLSEVTFSMPYHVGCSGCPPACIYHLYRVLFASCVWSSASRDSIPPLYDILTFIRRSSCIGALIRLVTMRRLC